MQSLLREMVDRDATARLPSPAYHLKQASSYDRRKTDPNNAETWHTNNDHEQFIRTETNEGRNEWVILEETGPGAITRFWTPLWGNKKDQIIRFYFDGASTPAISCNFNDLISGKGFVRPPLAFVSWDQTDLNEELKPGFGRAVGVGADLYLPIPFAKGCKITLDQVPFYYGINYRSYPAGTPVQTFSMNDFQAASADVERVSHELLAEPAATPAGVEKQATLAPGDELSVDLPEGENAVRGVQVHVDPQDAPQVLRSTILEAAFDDEPAIWCPLGEFFGAGARLHAVQDRQRTVVEDGTLCSRWVMPYQHGGRVSLKYLGTKPVAVKIAVTTAPWQWDDRSLHFHANWHSEHGIKTRPRSDWNYINIDGQGVYAGDTLTVFSPAKEWYGEGDERIYIDGEPVASHIGTGTEDYYGYAWGMADYFNSPFISAPKRDIPNRDSWLGYTTTSRLRLLDAIPFNTGIKHDMEIWNWADTQVDYAVGTFWYARPGVKSNVEPEPREAAAPIKEAPPSPESYKIAGAIECESMKIAGKTADLPTEIQYAALSEGNWSNGRQLFVRGRRIGDDVELEIPAKDDHPCGFTLYATKSWDYGIVQFSVNGESAGESHDLYNARAVASGPIELGTFQPHDGKFILRAEVVGSNPAATGTRCFFGLDCVVLKAAAGLNAETPEVGKTK